MSREKSDSLFILVKSLTQSEKRYIRLNVGKNSKGETKTMDLFDTILQQKSFNDEEILEKNPHFNPDQLSNLKAELYKHILHSLRSFHDGKIVDVQIRQLIDFAQLLVDRCLYRQANDQLKKAKKIAKSHDSLELMLEISKIEKRIINHIIDNQNQQRVNSIVTEVSHINGRINIINQLSNLEAKLNSLYKKVGFIRDQRDHNAVEKYLLKNLPDFRKVELSYQEKIHLHNLYTGYYFFIHDFENGYKEAKKFVKLFEDHPKLIISKIDFYLQALNKLLISQSKLSLYNEFKSTVSSMRAITSIKGLRLNDDIRAKLFKYYYMHEINRYFMLGDFQGGLEMIDHIEDGLEQFIHNLDDHSTIILYYKIACLYFGSSDYRNCIVWLNKIINNTDVDLRRDIHCFARIINLISHYELENLDVIDYYIRSTYRFLSKKYDLRLYQTYILGFLKNLGKGLSNNELKEEFLTLRDQLIPLSDKPYEKRAFIYFDIISWLESRIYNQPVGDIIRKKALQRIKDHEHQVHDLL